MTCRFEYNGKWHTQDELAKALENMPPHEASKYIDGVTNIPDAPFKKNWHELALKRAIREAAENGYDRLSWTPGEAQAARYDLSKQVSKVILDSPVWHGENDIRGNLVVTSKSNGSDLISKPVKTRKEIEDLIGKEATEKLINEPTNMQGRSHVLDGDGLKVGGEGMKGFYDNIVPKTIEKLGKQFGVKVQKGEVKVDAGKPTQYKDFADWEKAKKDGRSEPIFYIDIPPAMRDKVLAEGFPLFSANVPVIDNDQAR